MTSTVDGRGFILKSLDKKTIQLIRESFDQGIQKIPYLESSFPRCFYLTQRLVQTFQDAGKIYLSVYIVILLVRLRRGNQSQRNSIIKTLKELFNTTLFTSVYAMSIPISYCFADRLTDRPINTQTGFALSALFSAAIFLETPSRWSETSLFVSSQWVEAFAYSLKKRKLVPGLFSNWQVSNY